MIAGSRSTRPVAAYSLYRDAQLTSGLSSVSPWSELRDFPITPLSRLGDDVIVVPEEWMPAGRGRSYGKRILRVADLFPSDRPRSDYAYHEEQFRRAIFALFMIPRRTRRGVRLLKPSSWLIYSRVLLVAARWSLEHRYEASSLFKHMTIDDLAQMALHSGVMHFGNINASLAYFSSRGLLNDVPTIAQGQTEAERSAEQSYKDKELMTDGRRSAKRRQTQPYPDEFVTSFIPICLYISKTLGAGIVRAYERMVDEQRRDGSWDLGKRRRALLEQLDWSLPDGSTIDELPFAVSMASGVKHSAQRIKHWPPRSYRELRQWVSILQIANNEILSFCTGARWSEHAAARIDCLIEEDDARLKSRTYKIVSTVTGVRRSWPLTDEARDAVAMQRRLAQAVGGPKVECLWISVKRARSGGNDRAPGSERFEYLGVNAFVKGLGLDSLLNGVAPHSHRWRATAARLGAMALIEAPRVLMQLFGHQNVEMTLRYIFANPDIRQELVEAYAAAAYALAEGIVMEAERLEGPGAARLRSMIEEITAPLQGGLESETTRARVVGLLTIAGPAARAVRPGIKCLHQHGQYAPCSKNYGTPNPARCKVSCEHRLEDDIARKDTEAKIPPLIAELKNPDIQSRPLRLAWLRGQLLTYLRRFEDIRERWLASTEVARDVWDLAGESSRDE